MQQIALRVPDSLKTFGLLVALLLLGVSAVAIGLSREIALRVIYGTAIAQVVVIGRRYMNLQSEDLPIYALALLPVALAIILACVIAPDVGALR